MILGRYRTKPIVWAYAVLITAVVHVGVVLAGRLLHPFDPSPAYAHEPDAIEVVFAPKPDSPRDEPNFFSELPPDGADERPEHPDFLSNVDSRARDNVPGGGEGLPRLDGSSEAPHVRMEARASGRPEAGAGTEKATAEGTDDSGASQEKVETAAAAPSPNEVPHVESPRKEAPGREQTANPAAPEPGPARPSSFLTRERKARISDPLKNFRKEMFGTEAADQTAPGSGADDLSQDAMSNSEGNALLSGAISLNTVAWEYAPWLQRFRRDLLRRWLAPYGYYLGAIHGWTLVELEIARNGDLIRMDVLGEEGHEALRNASIAALRGAMPYQPLPEDFPEDTLILRVKLIYPEMRR